MFPKIKKMEFRNAHIDDEVYRDNDIFLHANGIETITPSHKTSLREFEHMLLHEPEAAVFGIGFRSKAKIDDSVIAAARKHKIDIHILPTPDAAKKFQELTRKGKKVVAKLHVTC